MLATYGVDVLDPGVSLRRIHVLVSRLPAGSLPRYDSPAAWSTEAHLLARLNDALDILTWVTVKANRGKAAKPKPLQRPGDRRSPVGGQRVRWADLAGALTTHGGMTTNGR